MELKGLIVKIVMVVKIVQKKIFLYFVYKDFLVIEEEDFVIKFKCNGMYMVVDNIVLLGIIYSFFVVWMFKFVKFNFDFDFKYINVFVRWFL